VWTSTAHNPMGLRDLLTEIAVPFIFHGKRIRNILFPSESGVLCSYAKYSANTPPLVESPIVHPGPHYPLRGGRKWMFKCGYMNRGKYFLLWQAKQLTVCSFVKTELRFFHNKLYFSGSCCSSVWVTDNKLILSKVIGTLYSKLPCSELRWCHLSLIPSDGGSFSSPGNVNHLSHLHGGTLRTYSLILTLLSVRVCLLPNVKPIARLFMECGRKVCCSHSLLRSYCRCPFSIIWKLFEVVY
jgi:hypothetical protein